MPRYDVVIECRSGTWRMVGDSWQDAYHVITWTTCESPHEASLVAFSLLDASGPSAYGSRQVRDGWVEVVHA